ncbi:MAG: hypothetical protein JWR10_516 [Rubritepida sp.]|nr:hypothetical protein [Rubritepida sp.]
MPRTRQTPLGQRVGLPLPSRLRLRRSKATPPHPVRFHEMPLRTLPDWSDACLSPPDGGDIFASRLWYGAILTHALPEGAEAVLAMVGEGEGRMMLPLLRGPGGLRSLTTPYTLEWRPLFPQADRCGSHAAGRSLGTWLHRRPPMRLEALDLDAPGLPALLAGIAATGISVQPYRHFGNWHEPLAEGAGWDGYLAARPSELRSTVQRKLKRAGREFRFELMDVPGASLQEGIAAYEEVRAQSWKPAEPFPAFDAALMQAAAAAGALRLGVLRDKAGQPLAAQYWLLSGGRAWLLKLCHAEASRAASPGTALTALMIRGLIESDGVRELDFGRGDDAYKRLWMSQRRQKMGVELAHAWHPTGFVSVARHRVSGWLGRHA